MFAIADCGGNSVQIFDRKGLKGEFETTLPVEKISISNQGVISIILKNGNTPYIVTYDSSGNILVENESFGKQSRNIRQLLDMSEDGTVLDSDLSGYRKRKPKIKSDLLQFRRKR